jgi:L-idonate 5-dehydrogenase
MRFKGSALRFPHGQGMFRDRLAIGAGQCHKIDPDVPMAEAALTEPLAVCRRAAVRARQIAGKRALVTGAGPIGALCAMLAADGAAPKLS